jgi:hypothetical protein
MGTSSYLLAQVGSNVLGLPRAFCRPLVRRIGPLANPAVPNIHCAKPLAVIALPEVFPAREVAYG